MIRSSTVLLVALVTPLTLCGAAMAGADPKTRPSTRQEAEFFEARVRPVLARHCFECHGPKKQKSGLRLDSRSALFRGGDSGPVVVAGDPANSLLVQAVRQKGALKMPPKGKLPPQAVEVIATWVKMGMPWPEEKTASSSDDSQQRHWAFQAVKMPPVPDVQGRTWCRTDVDRFILARLESKSLSPAPAADKRTLIRRATFDLIGLPPTPEEVAAFEADPRPDAFARVVDRLLASPHYGERWGRYWLDVARYADTKGYVFFEENDYPWAYTYRDYVIRAFNDDLPYDRFVLEQLAADQLLLGPDQRPLTALGFLTLGGRFMNNQQDILDDRIDTVTRGLLGLTVACARCHDHKFDPIPSKDYYSLYGVFAGCVEPTVPPLFEEPPQTPAYAAFAKELQARQQRLAQFVRTKHDELIQSVRTRLAEYLLAAHATQDQPNMQDFMLIAEGNDLNPHMVIRWQSYLRQTRKNRHPVFALWHGCAALPAEDFEQTTRGLCARFLSREGRIQPVNPLVLRAFATRTPRNLAEAAERYRELLNGVDRLWQQALADSAATGKPSPAALPDPAQEELRQVFYGIDSPTNIAINPVGDLDLLPDRPSQAKLQELRKAVETWRATGPAAPPRAMVLEDAPKPYPARVFIRGNPNNPGEDVPKQFLAVLSGSDRKPFEHGSGRLDLARAIVDRRNPLTARVLVNRIWLHHFGKGLVHTPSDFGLRSEPPTHPELLDYLAARFMQNGWSIKHPHRLIMLSAVYQQESDDRPACRAVDPENNLLWKMSRTRLDFEATRDALLATAGALDRRIGGRSFKDLMAAQSTRRTVYAYLDRLNVPGLFRTFDFPSPDASSPQRDVTTVAPQALFLMNNPFVLEQARRLLRRPEIASETDVARRVERLYHQCYGRGPSADEVKMGLDYLKMSKQEAAGWERYAQALLLANEFVFVD
jgi:Protein of unknown function (DUF1553)/Protein of unknown function (DUF1549)/Planctomycete cytochrome C